MRHSIIVGSVVALTGCSDELKLDLAACKAKTMDVYRTVPLSEENRQLTSGNVCAPKGGL